MKEVRTIIKHSAVYGSAVLLTRAVGFLLLPLYTRFLSASRTTASSSCSI